MDRTYLSEFSIVHGTEDGHGLDDDGVSRVIEMNLTFVPLDVSTVIDGQDKTHKDNHYDRLQIQELGLDDLSAATVLRTLLYATLNAKTIAAGQAYILGRTRNITGISPSMVSPSKHLTTAGGIPYKNRVDDWGAARMIKELSGYSGAKRLML